MIFKELNLPEKIKYIKNKIDNNEILNLSEFFSINKQYLIEGLYDFEKSDSFYIKNLFNNILVQENYKLNSNDTLKIISTAIDKNNIELLKLIEGDLLKENDLVLDEEYYHWMFDRITTKIINAKDKESKNTELLDYFIFDKNYELSDDNKRKLNHYEQESILLKFSLRAINEKMSNQTNDKNYINNRQVKLKMKL